MSATGRVATQDKIEAVLSPGQVVGGRYRVQRLLAEGGMAAVWAGANERTGKQVALKVILPTFASVPEAMELFRREALAASMVNHPNVVNIFDVIDHEGMTCIVMELLEGETLEAHLRERGPLALTEAAALLLPAMRGVAAANARGVVHRDLKPGNLFLCEDPSGRFLTTKVLDFGISMSAERLVNLASASGEHPVRFGTPAYMAPEDIEYPDMVDSRTDVYGFGVLLFEALAGKVPFPGQPSQELLSRILTEPPPKIATYRNDLPPAVQDVLDRTLAKNPSDRFPDVDHLIRVTEDHLATSLPLERSLSPIAGAAFLPHDPSAVAPSASDPARTAGSVSSHRGETRLLFSQLAGETPPPKPLAPAGRPADLVAGRKSTWFGFGHKLENRLAAAFVLAAVLFLVAWIAAHRHPTANAQSGHVPYSSEVLQPPQHVPVVTPLSVQPTPRETSAPPETRAEPAGLQAEALPEPPATTALAPSAAARAEIRKPKLSDAKGKKQALPRARRSYQAPSGGTLSASDF